MTRWLVSLNFSSQPVEGWNEYSASTKYRSWFDELTTNVLM